MESKIDFGRIAVPLAELGYLVFPLIPNDKKPLTEHGCKDATNDPAMIAYWAGKYPNANVGIHCKGLVVIDLDVKDGKNGIVDLAEVTDTLGPLPDCPAIVISTGGRHLYFKVPSVAVKNAQGVKWQGRKTGIDIRTEGGYVVAPDSVVSTGLYHVVKPLVPVNDLPDIPQSWLNDFLPVKESISHEILSVRPTRPISEGLIGRAERYLDSVDPAIQGQNGSDKLYWAVSVLLWGFLLDEDIVRQLILDRYNPRCVPEWSEKEIGHKISDSQQNPPNKNPGWLLEEQGTPAMNVDISGIMNSSPKTPPTQVHASKSLSEIYPEWVGKIMSGEPLVRFQCADLGNALNELAPEAETITTIGGAPGMSKTTLIQQVVFEALYRNEHLGVVLICNIEQTANALLNRELSRLARIPHTIVRNHDWDAEVHCQDRLNEGLEKIRQLGERVYFQDFPFTIERIVDETRRIDAKIVVVDYIQKIESRERTNSDRERIAIVLNWLRELASEGRAIIVASTLSRYSGEGKAYEASNIGSFRDSSDLEFSSTNAWILSRPVDETEEVNRYLVSVKRKEDEPVTLYMHFNGTYMCFDSVTKGSLPPVQSTKKSRKTKTPQILSFGLNDEMEDDNEY